ncbi:MAG: DNA polymerase III subunit gamma/tau [Bacteroidales bacterium]
MENYIVSARKYRPATFDSVVGQEAITRTLKNAIRNEKLTQAFLFCGPRGIGKTTCARILAKTINCENITENIEPCNQCESCRSFNQSASFNVHELDAASNNSVDDIRNLVEQVRIPPQVGKYKVYIIDEVHMLSASAFNAFLKTLEEPPPYAKFILATTEKHKIIPTILSRCQIFDFRRISVEDIASHLAFVAGQEKVEASEDALHLIAQKADGALRDALSIFDQLVSFAGKELNYQTVIENLNILDYDYYFRITEYILDKDIPNTLLTINEIISNGFDGQHFLIGMGEHLRNLLVSKDKATTQLLEVSPSLRDKYQVQSVKCSTGFLLRALDIGNRFDLSYKTSNHKLLHLELALMQMCSIGTGEEKDKTEKKKPLAPPERSLKTAPREPAPGKVKETRAHKIPTTKKEPLSSEKAKNGPVPGTISIRKNRNGNTDTAVKKTDEENPANKPRNAFSTEDLARVWKYYSESIRTSSPNLYSTLTKRGPVLKEDNVIELTIDNKVQDKYILEKKRDILEYLRKELKNYHLQLNTHIAREAEKDTKAYFPEEIYKKMSEKNPRIKELKDKLDLELDY